MTGTGVRIGKKTAGVRREMQEPFNSFAPDLASVNWRLFDYAPTSPSSLSSLPSLFSVLPLQIPTLPFYPFVLLSFLLYLLESWCKVYRCYYCIFSRLSGFIEERENLDSLTARKVKDMNRNDR